jgi:hypothetical protein
MQIGTIRTSFPGARERARHDVLACLSIDAAAFKSLLLGAGCHGRANHQTGSRPPPALFARRNLMGRTLALRARTVVSETSRFGRGCVRVAGESHTTRCAARGSICWHGDLLAGARFVCNWAARMPRAIRLRPTVSVHTLSACVDSISGGREGHSRSAADSSAATSSSNHCRRRLKRITLRGPIVGNRDDLGALRASHPGSPPAAAPPRRTGSDA